MKQIQPIIGQTFNAWIVVGIGNSAARWLCQCKCGRRQLVEHYTLRLNKSKSCHSCSLKNKYITHGEASEHTKTPEYCAYLSAKGRCNNPDNPAYKYYGGRGIEFHFLSYPEFLKHLGRRPSKNHSLDRFPNNDGHYESGNIRWAKKEQQIANRRNTIYLSAQGKTQTVTEWAKELSLKPATIRMRIHRGMSPLNAIFTPLRQNLTPP